MLRVLRQYLLLSTAAGVLGILLCSSAFAAKKCSDCHSKQVSEFKSRKFIHKPVNDENCESCHKRHGFANTLTLVDTTAQLCYNCHKESKDKFATGEVHFPVEKGKCWDCHDPHASDKKGIVRKGVAGFDDPGNCLVCHKSDLSRALEGTIKHEPFAKLLCLTCHEAHNSAHDGLLKKSSKELCSACHKVDDKKTLTAHSGKHTENLSCEQCHTGHSTDQKGLLSEKTHAPFSAGDCESCHSLPDAAGKVTFAEGVTPGSLCANCHEEQARGSSRSFPHAAVEKDNCETCHTAHSSRYPHLLKNEEAKICGECHADVASGAATTPHEPAMTGDCGKCHEVHGSDHEKLVRTTEATLCLGCHAEFKVARDSAKVIHAGAEDCLQCHSPHKGNSRAILRDLPNQTCSPCHETDPGAPSAKSSHKPYMNKECVACHSPHYSNRDHLVREDGATLCLSCHDEIKRQTTAKFPHPPATEDCLTCHKPHYSGEQNLLAGKQNELCVGCHDAASLGTDQTNAHTPAAQGDCVGCHNPHGAQVSKLLTGRAVPITIKGVTILRMPQLTGKSSDLCFSCHEGLSEQFRKQGVHAPVAEGKCTECHAAHGSNHNGFVKNSAPALCGSCHTLDDSLTARHSGYNLEKANCLDCHNPHISEKPKLVRAVTHPPFEEKACDNCHAQNADKSVLLSGTVTEICSNCHEVTKEAASRKHQHAPVMEGKCTSCHSPHSSDKKGLLKVSGNSLCLSCHTDQAQLKNQPVQHQPFSKGKCLDCHAAHGSNFAKMTVKPAEALCLSCHKQLSEDMAKGGTIHVPVKNGNCIACHLPHAGPTESLLKSSRQKLCATCHDLTSAAITAVHKGFSIVNANCQICHVPHVARKGVKALLMPDLHKPFAAGECGSCHKPIGKRELLSTTKELCLKCHTAKASDFLKPVVHPPLVDSSSCTNCHGPHVGFGKVLQIKEGVRVCLSCHNGPQFTGSVKHKPAFEDCATCHKPHAGDQRSLLETANIMDLCLTCHDDAQKTHFHPMGEKATDPRTKEPLNCVGCHSPHSSDQAALLKEDKNRRLCVLCHDLSHGDK